MPKESPGISAPENKEIVGINENKVLAMSANENKSEESWEEWDYFQEEIRDICASAPDIVPSVGIICGCFMKDWYRAEIISVEPEVRVHFIDVGCTTWYHSGLFKKLPDEIASEPPMKCLIKLLSDVEAKDDKTKDDDAKQEREVPRREEKVELGPSYFSSDFLVPEMPLMPFYDSYERRLETFKTVKSLYHYKEERVIALAEEGYCYSGSEVFCNQTVGSDATCHFCGNYCIVTDGKFWDLQRKWHYEGCKFAKEDVESIRFFVDLKTFCCRVCKSKPFEVLVLPCSHGTCIRCAKLEANICPVCQRSCSGLKVPKVRGMICIERNEV